MYCYGNNLCRAMPFCSRIDRLKIGNGEKIKWMLFQPTKTKTEEKNGFVVGCATVVVKPGHCVEDN